MIKKCKHCQEQIHKYNTRHQIICFKNKDYIEYLFNGLDRYIKNYSIFYGLYITKNYSIRFFTERYKISRRRIEQIIKYYNLPLKTISEGTKFGAKNSKKTCLKKYGVDNISQLEYIKEKKRKTCLKNYGVDNIRKSKIYYENAEKTILKNYGITKSELASIRSKELWDSKTKEERDVWIKNSIFSRVKGKRKGFITSKGEKEIAKIIIDLGFKIETQFMIRYNSNKNYFSYDILIQKEKLIVEYNGDFYHANPKKYKECDIFTYPIKRTAKEIWIKDELKKLLAIENGYNIIYIWESELLDNKYNKKQFIKNKIYERIKN